jgi:hypothetical protein
MGPTVQSGQPSRARIQYESVSGSDIKVTVDPDGQFSVAPTRIDADIGSGTLTRDVTVTSTGSSSQCALTFALGASSREVPLAVSTAAAFQVAAGPELHRLDLKSATVGRDGKLRFGFVYSASGPARLRVEVMEGFRMLQPDIQLKPANRKTSTVQMALKRLNGVSRKYCTAEFKLGSTSVRKRLRVR